MRLARERMANGIVWKEYEADCCLDCENNKCKHVKLPVMANPTECKGFILDKRILGMT